jgi:hypothetical protein
VSGAVHEPQSCTLPQPSGAIPQLKPRLWQLVYAGHVPPLELTPELVTMKTPVDPPLPALPAPPALALPAPLEPLAATPPEPVEAPFLGALPHDATARTTADKQARREQIERMVGGYGGRGLRSRRTRPRRRARRVRLPGAARRAGGVV